MAIFSKIIFLSLMILFASIFANAQPPAEPAPPGSRRSSRDEDLPTGIKENLIKQRIKQQEKEFADILKRGEEATKIADELAASFEQNETLRSSDQKKLQRLEKLVKKIRQDLGGEDVDAEDEKSSDKKSLGDIVKDIHKQTSTVLSELKKAGRHSISLVAIESANAVLRAVRFLRFSR